MRPWGAAVIPAHVPHLYHFLEDTLMTESWVHAANRTQCAFQVPPHRCCSPRHTMLFTQ